jgi:hypothetical protein
VARKRTSPSARLVREPEEDEAEATR